MDKKIFKQTVVRYGVSYFGVYFVLILAFFFVFKNRVVNQYFMERQKNIQIQMETVAANLCENIEYLNQIKSALYQDMSIVQSQYSDDGEYIMQVMKAMNSYDAATNMINSVIYMTRISHVVYSTNLSIFY